MAQQKLVTRIALRNDSTANWVTSKDQVLLKGEVGIEFLDTGKVKMKVGDGVTTWENLKYFGGDECHVYEATATKGSDHLEAINTAVGTSELNKGDIAIVKEEILSSSDVTTSNPQKYQYTAYVYGETADGTAWKAMDGNYNASNVYFDEDFVFTKAIGTVTIPSSGSTTVAAAGKNIPNFFKGVFAQEVAGSIKTQPYVSVSLTGAGKYEVGSTVTPSYSATFNSGAYTYGPDPTGVTVSSWEVTSTASESWTTASGTGAKITVADSTNYYVTAKATHTEGAAAKSNIGNTGTIKISSGTKTANSTTITGYRTQFYGAQVTPITISSSTIRGLTGKVQPTNTFTGKYGKGNGFILSVPEGCTQVVIALYGRTLKNVFDNAAFGTDIKGSFTEVSSTSAVSVEGANGYTGVNYNVYVYSPSAALGANTYDCVIG